MGIKRIKIYEVGSKVYADVDYFDNTRETIQWNFKEERKRILNQMDGYTFIQDTRI